MDRYRPETYGKKQFGLRKFFSILKICDHFESKTDLNHHVSELNMIVCVVYSSPVERPVSPTRSLNHVI